MKWDGQSGTPCIIYHGHSAYSGYGILLNSDAVPSQSLTIICGGKGYAVSSTLLPVGAWHHIAVVRESGVWKLYLDGTGLALSNSSVIPNTPTDAMNIGSISFGGQKFDGSIDEVRIWEVARSQTDIQSAMHTELTGTETGLIAYYKMNEGSGTTINDNTSVSLFDGTLVNSPSWINGVFIPGGSGTYGDPYLIANINHLKWISDNSSTWGSYFQQTTNIDASITSSWNSGQGWLPIGNLFPYFSGTYDGQGYTISGLHISRPGTNPQGLFGISSGTIQNLGVVNTLISGQENVGAIAGILANGTVNSCYSTGAISASYGNGGGLIGWNNGWGGGSSTITQCYSTCNITGGSNRSFGGLVGYSYSSSISNCYSTGRVTGSNAVGGLIGQNESSTVNYCYSISKITSGGGLIGVNYLGTVNNSFWNTDSAGSSEGGTGKTTVEMKIYSTYTGIGWDFMDETTNGTNNYWGINETGTQNNGYPFLSYQGFSNLWKPVVTTLTVTNITSTSATGNGNITWLGSSTPTEHGVCWSTSPGPTLDNNNTTLGSVSGTGPFTSAITGLVPVATYYVRAYATNSVGTSYGEDVSFTTNLFEGSGTTEEPYLIGILDDLKRLSENSSFWDKCFKQTADIDASSTSGWDSGMGFTPIGNSSTKFTGHYDGDGHTISGLTIVRSMLDGVGLFGKSYNAELINIGMINTDTRGYINVGGIVGLNDNYSSISNCYSTGSVIGYFNVGGLAGRNTNNSQISSSYSTASVTGITGIGGFVGSNDNNSSVNNCYSIGNVSGVYGTSYDNVGGFVGSNYNAIVSNCYSTGNVSGESVLGGFAGKNSYGTVSCSFWDLTTSGTSTGIGNGNTAGVTGKTTAEMKNLSTFTDAGWDFYGINSGTIWNIGNDRNNGYPYLQWQYPEDAPLPVEFVSFSASTQGNKVILKWQTATEVNNYGFEIQRAITNYELQTTNSPAGLADWERVGFVEGAGNSNSPKEYSFIDDQTSEVWKPFSTQNLGGFLYRLKQIDIDGKFTYSNEVEVNIKLIPTEFTLEQNYPNPFNPTTTIRYSIPSVETQNVASHIQIKIYDVLGNEVTTLVNEMKAPGYYEVQWNAGNAASGIYFYRIYANSESNGKNFSAVKKMLVIK